MRVAFISSLNGGVGTFTVEVVRELSHYVEELDLYLFSSSEKEIPIGELPENVKIVAAEKSALTLFLKLLISMNHLKTCDIIHLNYASFILPVYITKKLWNVPYIYTSHNFPVPKNAKLLKRLPHICEAIFLKFASKNAEKHITISNYAKTNLEEIYKTSPIIINYGINTEKYKYDANKREALRATLGFTEDDFLILFVGVLYKHKNAITLVNALPEVMKINPAAKLLIAGDGVQYDEIQERIKALQLDGSIFMPGFIAEIAPYYSAADLFVLPSTNEGFGFVFLEAMASGLPIATSNCSSCPEAVGDAGLLFDPLSSSDVADKLIALMTNDGLREQLRANGLRRVEQFTWARAAERYYDVYRQALGEEKNT